MHSRIKLLLSINRYPEFLVDLLAAKIQFLLLRLSRDFRIGKGAAIRGLPVVTLASGSSIQIGAGIYLVSRSRNTALGVNHPSILRTLKEGARIRIGDYFRASGVTICAYKEISIGNRVAIGANVTIVDTDFHSVDPATRFSRKDAEQAKAAPVTIGDDVFIGMGAMILKGVTIGRAAIIGAGALVSRDVPESAVAAGNPAKILSLPLPEKVKVT